MSVSGRRSWARGHRGIRRSPFIVAVSTILHKGDNLPREERGVPSVEFPLAECLPGSSAGASTRLNSAGLWTAQRSQQLSRSHGRQRRTVAASARLPRPRRLRARGPRRRASRAVDARSPAAASRTALRRQVPLCPARQELTWTTNKYADTRANRPQRMRTPSRRTRASATSGGERWSTASPA